MMQMESSKDSLEELVLSLRHVGLGDGLGSSGLAARDFTAEASPWLLVRP